MSDYTVTRECEIEFDLFVGVASEEEAKKAVSAVVDLFAEKYQDRDLDLTFKSFELDDPDDKDSGIATYEVTYIEEEECDGYSECKSYDWYTQDEPAYIDALDPSDKANEMAGEIGSLFDKAGYEYYDFDVKINNIKSAEDMLQEMNDYEPDYDPYDRD